MVNSKEFSMNAKKTEAGQGILIVLIVIGIIVGIIYGIVFVFEQLIDYTNEKVENYQNKRVSNTIVFAGRATDVVSGDWPNQHLAVLFLNGEEIGRTETIIGDFEESGDGIHDGLFVIKVKNNYKLNVNDFKFDGNRGLNFSWKKNSKWLFSTKMAEIYRWFGNVEIGEIIEIPVPNKNLTYSIFIFDIPASQLPLDVQTIGSLTLKHDGTVYADGQPLQ
jgi:hypothetical protein